MVSTAAKAAFTFLTVSLLAGCDSGAEITTPPVTFAYSEDFDQKRLLESYDKPFRTYAPTEKGKSGTGPEITGATCLLKSREFQARFVTPAKVALPIIKGKPSPMKVTCKAGDKTVEFVGEPFKPQTVFIGDPLTAVVATMASAAITAASDRWHYVRPDETVVRVILE